MSHVNIASEVRMANGITDGLIRVSVGIEHSLDIIADIDQAISAGVSG
jgi:cystathionine beta-lyase/cystathionine gamma-synthase